MKINDKIYKVMTKAAGILSAAALAMCISSCSDDDYADVSSTKRVRISFASPVVGSHSRVVPDYEHGAIVDGKPAPFHKEEKIMVFGTKYALNGQYKIPIGKDIPWATGTIYGPWEETNNGPAIVHPGEEASYDPSVNAWDTKEPHYWDPGYYAFSAYSPSDLKNYAVNVERTNRLQPKDQPDKYGIEEFYVEGYQTPAIGQQFDFMFSETVYEVQGPTPKEGENGNPYYNGVNLRFMHALSSIHFKVRLDPNYVKDIAQDNRQLEASRYSIKSIVLSGVYDKADFLERAGYKYDATANEGKGKNTYLLNPDKQKMWYNIFASEGASAYNSLNTTGYDFIDPASPVDSIPYEIISGDITAKDVKELDNKAHIGFMIPQALTAEAKVVVTWTYSDGSSTSETTKEFYLNNAAKNPVKTTEWLMGNRYTYTITISNDYIEFSPTAGTGWNDVDGWTDGANVINTSTL